MSLLTRIFGGSSEPPSVPSGAVEVKAEPPSTKPGGTGPAPSAIDTIERIRARRPESNAVVEGAAGYLHRNVAEPGLFVYREGKETPDLHHPAYLLWKRPFKTMTGRNTLKLCAVARMLMGDYFLIPQWDNERRRGAPVGLRFANAQEVTAERGFTSIGSPFQDVTGWHYRGKRYEVEQIVHGMLCPNPRDPWVSKNPLRDACKAWIGADNQLAEYQYCMLVNPVASTFIVSPGTAEETWHDDDVVTIKEKLLEQSQLHHRGEPIVLGRNAAVNDVGVDQSKQALDKVAAIPQERILAAIGLPAGAIGINSRSASGLADQGSMVSEARTMATLDYLVPFWVDFEELLNTQLMPLFGADAIGYEFRFDLSTVKTLQAMQLQQEATLAKIRNPNPNDPPKKQ